MATLAEHERATSDLNLMRRVISASQIERIPNSQSGVQENLAEIVSTKIDVFETETTLTNLLTFAFAGFEPGKNPEPGSDAIKIADEAVFATVRNSQTQPAEAVKSLTFRKELTW